MVDKTFMRSIGRLGMISWTSINILHAPPLCEDPILNLHAMDRYDQSYCALKTLYSWLNEFLELYSEMLRHVMHLIPSYLHRQYGCKVIHYHTVSSEMCFKTLLSRNSATPFDNMFLTNRRIGKQVLDCLMSWSFEFLTSPASRVLAVQTPQIIDE